MDDGDEYEYDDGDDDNIWNAFEIDGSNTTSSSMDGRMQPWNRNMDGAILKFVSLFSSAIACTHYVMIENMVRVPIQSNNVDWYIVSEVFISHRKERYIQAAIQTTTLNQKSKAKSKSQTSNIKRQAQNSVKRSERTEKNE